jgi:hypothetical protein
MTEADWRERLRAKDNAIFLIYNDEAPIGMTCVSIDRDDPTRENSSFMGFMACPGISKKRIVGSDVSNSNRLGKASADRRKNYRFPPRLKSFVKICQSKTRICLYP